MLSDQDKGKPPGLCAAHRVSGHAQPGKDPGLLILSRLSG